MQLRILLPGILWCFLLFLVYLAPLKRPDLYFFDIIPPRALINMFLFWGLSHIWLGIFKKSWKSQQLLQYLVPIISLSTIGLIVCLELIRILVNNTTNYVIIFVLFNIIGTIIGVMSHKLLYRRND